MTEAEFAAELEHIVGMTQQLFEKDRVIIHISFLILGDGTSVVVPFAQFEKSANDHGVERPDDCKAAVFEYIAHQVREMKAVGYIDVSEAWMLSPLEGSAEPALDFWKRVGPIRNNPGRLEALVVHAAFGRSIYMKTWKIRRRDKEAWLEPHMDSKAEIDPEGEKELAGTNMGRIDLAIMKNAETAFSG